MNELIALGEATAAVVGRLEPRATADNIIPFPRLRRVCIEVEACVDAAGAEVYIFDLVEADGGRCNLAIRNSVEEARDDIAWLRRGGDRVHVLDGCL